MNGNSKDVGKWIFWVLIVAFAAGGIAAAVGSNGSRISKVETTVQSHDREIGSLTQIAKNTEENVKWIRRELEQKNR